MKTNFKIGFLLLSICMILAMTSIMGVFAAEANISMDLSESEVTVGDTFTVVINNADLNAAGFGVVLDYSAQKELIECTDVTGVDDDEYLGMYYSGRKGAATWIDANVGNDAENTNSDGIFSFGVVTGKATDFFEGKVATLTFTAKAAGTVTFTLTERTSGTDAFDGVVETFTLTIKESAPACEHPEEKLTSKVIEDPTCEEPGTEKITCECGHSYTKEIPAYHNNNMEYHPEKDALDCANPGNIEYWYCPGCYECFEDAYAEIYINPWYIEITVECVRPEGIADCAMFTCETCGNENYGYGEHDVLACKGGVCSKCNAEIEGNGCQNLDTPACTDGLCYYCGGFVAGFGHENGAWAPCCDGECAYGCGLLYPATEEHVDADSDDYCDNCWNHLKHVFEDFDPCVGGECTICWAWVDGEHEYTYTCDAHCAICHELTNEGAAHNIIHVEATAPTCTAMGNIEYWYCDICGQAWLDAECTLNTNLMAVKLPMAEHEYFYGCDPICMNCGELTNPDATHSMIHVEAKPADCTNDGNIEYWYCEYCGLHCLDEECTLITSARAVKIAASCKYNAIHMDAVPASCHYNGNREYWFCANCDVYYLDEECTIITSLKNVIISAEKTTADHVPAKAATCTETGNVEHWYCAECRQYWLDEALTQLTSQVAVTTEKNFENHVNAPTYTFDDFIHTAVYSCCDTQISNVHNVDPDTHKCFCGAVEKFTLTISDFNDNFIKREVPYGTNILEYVNSLVNSGVLNIAARYENYFEDDYAIFGKRVFNTWRYLDEDYFEYDIPAEMIVEQDITVYAASTFTGWITYDGENWAYQVNSTLLEGWYQVNESNYTVNGTGSAWYYFNEKGYRVSGLTRVPYPTVEINGIKYAPNAADKAYWEAHKDTSKYSDATTALFYFDEDGKFVQYNGVEGKSYFVNGMAPWHVGFVAIDGDYYYFGGDKANGGNVMLTGKVYATRDYNSGKAVGADKIYYFAEDGKLIEGNEGIVEMADGYYYFIGGKLAYGAGVVKMTDDEGKTFYIYVKSNGQLATGIYWPTTLNGELERGAYNWGTDGKYYPDVQEEEIREVDGVYYYYVNGIKKPGAGVVEMTDAEGATFYIYVRSNGQLATGEYWPTTLNGLLPRGKYDWGKDGKYYPDAE